MIKAIILILFALITLSSGQAENTVSLTINTAIVNVTWEYTTESIMFHVDSALDGSIDTGIS